MASQRRAAVLQVMRQPLVVAVEERDVLAPGEIEPGIPGRIGAAVRLVPVTGPVAERGRQTFDQGTRVVGAAVVDDDQLPVPERLGVDRRERLPQE